MIKKTEIELMNLLIYIVSFAVVYSVYIATTDSIVGICIPIILAIAIYYGVNRLKDRKSDISMNLTKKKFRIVPLMFITIITIIIEYSLSNVFTFGISGNQKRVLEEMKNAPIHETLLSNVIEAPIVEEILFRGIILLICFTVTKLLFQRLSITEGNKNKIAALIFLVISSMSFSLVHMTEADRIVLLLPYAISGLIFAYIYIITQNIITSMVVHGIGNLIATFIGLSQYHIVSVNLVTYIFVGIIVVLVILLLIMCMQYLNYVADYKDEKKEITSLVKDEIFEKITFG